jgi:hypothetical protein
MKDEILLKISLLTACVGLFMLFLIFYNNEINIYTIEELQELPENEKIIVYGEILNLKENDKVASFEIFEYKMISQEGIMFKKNSESTKLRKGDNVKISGTWYDNKIIIETIDKWDKK